MNRFTACSLLLLASSPSMAAEKNFFQMTLGEFNYTSSEREAGGNQPDVETSTTELRQPVQLIFNFGVSDLVTLRPVIELENSQQGVNTNTELFATFKVMKPLDVGLYLALDRSSSESEQGNAKQEITNSEIKIGPTARYTVDVGAGDLEVFGTAAYISESSESDAQNPATETENSGFGVEAGADISIPVTKTLAVTAGGSVGYVSMEEETKNQGAAGSTKLDNSAWQLSVRPIGVRMTF